MGWLLLSLSASDLWRSYTVAGVFIRYFRQGGPLVLGAAVLVVDTTDALLDELVSLDVVEDGALALFASDLGRGR